MVREHRSLDRAISPEVTSSISKGHRLGPDKLLSAGDNKVNFLLLESLRGNSIVGAADLGKDVVVELCRFAALLEMTEIARHHPLDGKLVITAFFEASTRTRLSFESAVLRLDGKVVSVPDGRVTGIAKGESLADIGEMFNSYGDLVILRHPQESAVRQLRANLVLPMINAGNGTGEHPTQALIDWYSLLRWRPELCRTDCPPERRIHLAVIGNPTNMRSVRSFLKLSSHFASAISALTLISEQDTPLDPELEQELMLAGIEPHIATDLNQVLPDVDVTYMNSITLLEDGYHQMGDRFRLHAGSALKPGSVILHPFARRDELDTALDSTSHNLYFSQAAGAVFIRQALLIAVLGRLDALPSSVLFLAN